MDDSPIMIRKKRQKTVEFTSCVICGEQAPSDELVKPKDAGSWQTLCAAAEVRMFEPILTLNADNPNTIPVVFYHRECRSKFTHKKELARFIVWSLKMKSRCYPEKNGIKLVLVSNEAEFLVEQHSQNPQKSSLGNLFYECLNICLSASFKASLVTIVQAEM